MGVWRITIDGMGCHHNGKREIDADLAAADFVAELKAQGHAIREAVFEMVCLDQVVDSPLNVDLLAPK